MVWCWAYSQGPYGSGCHWHLGRHGFSRSFVMSSVGWLCCYVCIYLCLRWIATLQGHQAKVILGDVGVLLVVWLPGENPIPTRRWCGDGIFDVVSSFKAPPRRSISYRYCLSSLSLLGIIVDGGNFIGVTTWGLYCGCGQSLTRFVIKFNSN
jgi:hypothetical protein